MFVFNQGFKERSYVLAQQQSKDHNSCLKQLDVNKTDQLHCNFEREEHHFNLSCC